MGNLSTELLSLIYYLVPGFLAAWIFHGLTAHPRPTPFERIVHALIFTVLIQGTNIGVEQSLLILGSVVSLGRWSTDSEFVSSIVLAALIGLVSVRVANRNTLHEWLRDWPLYERLRCSAGFSWLPEWQWTSRTSYPSEWFSAFTRAPRYIVLHLTGNRRLHGWPEEWPDHPKAGHFVICQPQWLLDDGRMAPLHKVETIMISASEVEMVEFLKPEDEVTATDDEIQAVEQMLITENQEGETHGHEVSATSASEKRRQSAGVATL